MPVEAVTNMAGHRADVLRLVAPMSGVIVAMSEVPDPVFAESTVGPGVAIEPFAGGLTVVSPCAGTVRTSRPHGFIVQLDQHCGILIHLGLDTVELGGEGFTELVREGQHIEANQPIMVWNTSVASKSGYRLCSPIVAIGADDVVPLGAPGAKVEVGKPLCDVRWSGLPATDGR